MMGRVGALEVCRYRTKWAVRLRSRHEVPGRAFRRQVVVGISAGPNAGFAEAVGIAGNSAALRGF